MSGRPLRFLAAILTLWVTLRLVAWWPEGSPPNPVLAGRTDPPGGTASFLPLRESEMDHWIGATRSAPMLDRSFGAVIPRAAIAPLTPDRPVETPHPTPVGWSPFSLGGNAMPAAPPAVYPDLSRLGPSPDRWALSIWGIARDGRIDTLATGQLGASQLGVRATYMIDAPARVALTARISAPVRGQGREAALGIDWQPVSASVHVIAEQRLPLDGGATRPAAFVTGGLDHAKFGVRVEGYGQAGGVLRRGLFADGALRLTTPVARLHLGVGSWAGAQRGASRFDIGPTVALVLPVADRGVRLTLDWRHRIAGDARPGSGPALSIGGDF